MSAVSAGTATAGREVVVVGGGQAGLAVGYFLPRQRVGVSSDRMIA